MIPWNNQKRFLYQFIYHKRNKTPTVRAENFKILPLKLLSDFWAVLPSKSNPCNINGIHPWKIFKNV